MVILRVSFSLNEILFAFNNKYSFGFDTELSDDSLLVLENYGRSGWMFIYPQRAFFNVLKYVLYDIRLVNESRLTLRLFAVVFILLMVFFE